MICNKNGLRLLSPLRKTQGFLMVSVQKVAETLRPLASTGSIQGPATDSTNAEVGGLRSKPKDKIPCGNNEPNSHEFGYDVICLRTKTEISIRIFDLLK